MRLDPAATANLTRSFRPVDYLRTTPLAHRTTPLGMGFGSTRFASPSDTFKLLYVAQDLSTSIAEAIVRDRFEGTTTRELMRSEVAGWGVCVVNVSAPLRVLDLRGDGCFQLGVSTEIVGAKAQDLARDLSQAVHDTTSLDGILYRSRLRGNKSCVAVYERAVAAKLSSSAVVELERLKGLVPALRRLRTNLIA